MTTQYVQSPLPQPAYLPVEPPPGTVITWQQQFAADGPVYTYVAIRVAWRGWFVSNDSETAYTWPELIYWLVGRAPVFVAVGWRPL